MYWDGCDGDVAYGGQKKEDIFGGTALMEASSRRTNVGTILMSSSLASRPHGRAESSRYASNVF